MNLLRLQGEVHEWSLRNFGNVPPHQSLLGIGEELGELNHAYLKGEQKIREHHDATIKTLMEDALGDMMIYMADFASRVDIDLDVAVAKTWAEVKQRDWKKHPKNGLTE